MADIKRCSERPSVSEAEIRDGVELMFFAYRDFIAGPDTVLARYGFGRAHHRVIYFVGRHPQMTVSELLGILQITKQSLSRVLSELVQQGFVAQYPGPHDRRQRLLELTAEGRALEREVSAPQRAQMGEAYRQAGAVAVAGFRKVMLSIIAAPADRSRFDRDSSDEH